MKTGQVIVSTGKVGTGYIRLNANPNDSSHTLYGYCGKNW